MEGGTRMEKIKSSFMKRLSLTEIRVWIEYSGAKIWITLVHRQSWPEKSESWVMGV